MNSSIGIFDSGVGGFSVFKEIYKQMPRNDYIYVADQKHFPYGKKTKQYVLNRAKKISEFFIEKRVKIIVVACNTATTAAIEDLRKEYPQISFVGAEPAIKPAAIRAKGKPFLVCATEGTIQSEKLKKLIETYSNGSTVKLLSMPTWYEMVENGEISGKKVEEELRSSLRNASLESMDSIVLACTHYPLLKESLKKVFPGIIIFDPSKAIANRVNSLVDTKIDNRGKVTLYATGDLGEFKSISKSLLPFESKVEWVKI